MLVQPGCIQRLLDYASESELPGNIFIYDGSGCVYTDTIFEGALNSATQFQARMVEIFTDLLYKSVIICIDDVLGYAPTGQTWFSTLRRTLQLADKFDLKLNIDKCHFFLKEVKICGRIFSPQGVKRDMIRIGSQHSLRCLFQKRLMSYNRY
jgi:hypothetical protein